VLKVLRLLFAPFRFLLRLLTWPLRKRARHKAAGSDGWIELHLEGAIVEVRTPSRIPRFVRRWLGDEDDPKVTMSRVRKLMDEVIADPKVEGLMVRVGPLSGGWASASALRTQLARVRAAGKRVLVHFKGSAGNREYLVASAAEQLWGAPTEAIAPVGAAATTLFYKDVLDQAGVSIEVASAGRFKSAPEAFTRTERSEADREQTTALVDRIDRALVDAVAEAHAVDGDAAKAMMDRAPTVGAAAVDIGLCHRALHDEDLPEAIAEHGELESPPTLVPAGSYLNSRVMTPLIRARRKKHVGIVEVHGAIMERASPYSGTLERVALEKVVVANLRAALANKRIGAVVLHVNSPGGGVAASDAIYAAVRRLDADKPVIACFADVAASGGYYVACGAREIVASPLTVTGSIGVFGMIPVFAALGGKLGLHHDVIKNRARADLYDVWRPRTEDERAHAQREIDGMYEAFLKLVSDARGTDRDTIHEVAQGRVWTGDDAADRGLVDSLGGMEEALDRAKSAGEGRFHELPVLVRAKTKPMPRPKPVEADAQIARSLLRLSGLDRRVIEMAALSTAAPRAMGWLYTPLDVA